MLVFVVALWVLIIVGVACDVLATRRDDARRRRERYQVPWETPHELMSGERMTLDVPVTTESREAWGRLRNALCNTRQQRRKAARSSSRARLVRSVLRALRKRQSVRKLLPVRGMFR